ncbi:MAG: ABC transporter permease subunit [Planctomycetota bacterium]
MNSLAAVFLHEWRRSLTPGRIVWWLLMCLFPIAVSMLIRFRADVELDSNQPLASAAEIQTSETLRTNRQSSAMGSDQSDSQGPDEEQRRAIRDGLWSVFLYVMIPCLSSALGVLLTAGPAVASELEQRSWVYLATRPNGIVWLLLGKFLVAFTWGYSSAMIALTGAIAFVSVSSRFAVWWPMALLSGLSCLAYSGAFLLVGAIFPKRAMVFSIMYMAIVEVVLGSMPAMVNRLTVQYRLRSLMLRWLELNEPTQEFPRLNSVIGSDPAWLHVVWLFGLTTVYFAIAQLIVHKREFTTASEGDL